MNSSAFDLLEMVGENTIIGKEFLGSFGQGVELFNFSRSRVYDVDFITEDDLLTTFKSNELSHKVRNPKNIVMHPPSTYLV